MRQYAADQVKVAWPFVGDITPGLAAGTFIQPVRNRSTWRQKPDGLGNTLRLFNADKSGHLTLLIDAESREHQALMTIVNQDRVAQVFVAPLVIADLNTKEIAFYNKAYIATDPNIPKGVSGAIIPWRFDFNDVIQQPFGLNANAVGD